MRTCLVGLQNSGKSTALAALWFSVAERSNLCEWYLSNSDRPSDSSHWTELRDRWLEGKSLQRTEHTLTPKALKLKLSRNGGEGKLEIVAPDIAGEDFQKIYELGRFPRKHATLLENTEHMVFFVHVENYDHPVSLKAPEKLSAAEVDALPKTEPQEWLPNQMYPGSKIVAVLRGIQQILKNGIPRVTVALTAWDLVPDGLSPSDVLRQRFPLLDQYLKTNLEFTLVGVSAQGCDYENEASLVGIELDDIKRISVVENEIHHDITRVFA